MVYSRFRASNPAHGEPAGSKSSAGTPMPPYPWYHIRNVPSRASRMTVPYSATLPSHA